MKRILLTGLSVFLSFVSFAIGAITGTTHVCISSTTTLSDTTSGGTWSSSTPTMAVIGSTTGIVTGVSAGVVTITYTAGSSYVTTPFTVNPLPAPITVTPYLCVGDVDVLSDATPGGSWTGSNPSVVYVDPLSSMTGISAGTAVVSYTLPTGCYAIMTVTVNPIPAPLGGSTSLCLGDTTTMTDVAAGGTWSSSNPAVGSISPTTGLLTGIAAGTTVISYTHPSGCPGSVTMTVISCTPTGLNETHNEGQMNIYPNPANDELNITGVKENTKYRMFTITGNCVSSGTFSQRNNIISIGKLSQGIYSLEITGADNERKVVRMAKE